MPASPFYGLFSPAIPEEKGQSGIPSSVKTFSQQVRFLNDNLFLPHKENGDMSELSFSDQVYICRINSDDKIRVGERIVLFPNKKQSSINFPLLLSEKKAKHLMHDFLLKALEEDNTQLDIEDKADYIGTYVGLITLVDKLKPILADKISRWLVKNQDKLSIVLTQNLNQILESLSTENGGGDGEFSHENLLRHLDNFRDTFYIKTVGLVICLIETDENYASTGDLVQVKLQLNG